MAETQGIDIRIEASRPLAKTAMMIAETLDIEFSEETDARVAECPAYMAEQNGIRYALIALPSPPHEPDAAVGEDYWLVVMPPVAQSVGILLGNLIVQSLRTADIRAELVQ